MSRTRIARAAGTAAIGLILCCTAVAGPHAFTRTIVTQRTANGHVRDTTVVSAQGQTATRHAVVSNDAATGTRTRDVDYTGFSGKTASVDTVTQRTAGGYTRDTTATGPNGKVATRSVVASCDKAAKSCTKTISVNGGGG